MDLTEILKRAANVALSAKRGAFSERLVNCSDGVVWSQTAHVSFIAPCKQVTRDIALPAADLQAALGVIDVVTSIDDDPTSARLELTGPGGRVARLPRLDWTTRQPPPTTPPGFVDSVDVMPLAKAARAISWAAVTEYHRSAQSGVHVYRNSTDNQIYLAATDGRVVACALLPETLAPLVGITIDAGCIDQLPTEGEAIVFGDYLWATDGDQFVGVKLISARESPFPNVEAVTARMQRSLAEAPGEGRVLQMDEATVGHIRAMAKTKCASIGFEARGTSTRIFADHTLGQVLFDCEATVAVEGGQDMRAVYAMAHAQQAAKMIGARQDAWISAYASWLVFASPDHLVICAPQFF